MELYMSKNNYVWAGVIIAIFFWASNFNAIKAINPEISPLLAAALRFTVAALFLAGLRGVYRPPNEILLTRRNKYDLFVITTIGVTIQNFSIFFAMKYTQAVNASVVMANMPLAGILLSALLLKTPITRFNIAGALVSIVGVILVITGGDMLSLSFNSGDLLMVAALTSGCLYTILSKLWTSNIPVGQQLRWMMCLGALQMLVVAAVKGDFLNGISLLAFKDIALIVYMGLCGTLLAYYFWMKGAFVLGPHKVTSLFNTLPVFTLIISILAGTEAQWIQIVGIAFVGIGVFIGNAYPYVKQRLQSVQAKQKAAQH